MSTMPDKTPQEQKLPIASIVIEDLPHTGRPVQMKVTVKYNDGTANGLQVNSSDVGDAIKQLINRAMTALSPQQQPITETTGTAAIVTPFVTPENDYVTDSSPTHLPDKHQRELTSTQALALSIMGLNENALDTDFVVTDMNKHAAEIESIIARTNRESRIEALQPFLEAFTNKGSHPDYHDAQVQRLRREWPTLYNLLSALESKQESSNE